MQLEQIGKGIAFNLGLAALCLFAAAAWIVKYAEHTYDTKLLVLGVLFLVASAANGAVGVRLMMYQGESARLAG